MRFSSLLTSSLLLFSLIHLSSACCCPMWQSCYCNFFGCNCPTDEGYCYFRHKVFKNGIFSHDVCKSSKNTNHAEYCPDRRRRKRSLTGAVKEADYAGGLYDHLMERAAMEKFLDFDLNKDGQISMEEANATLDEFKQVDENNDGFVHPGELDISLR